MLEKITIIQPDDCHCHLRDQATLFYTVAQTAKYFARAIIMPNLTIPVTSIVLAEEYCYRIMHCLPPQSTFQPMMTLYLNETVSLSTLREAKQNNQIIAAKLYPANVTTHSAHGVTELSKIYPQLEVMQEVDLPLLIHAEINDPKIDVFDREAAFIDKYFGTLIKKFPLLRIVFEHVSTKTGVDFVKAAPPTLAATITPHHLWFTRQDLFNRGIYPHRYCLPIVKTEKDRMALIEAATSGNPKFFLGTDTAPHPQSQKESACGPAGIYNAPSALATYAEIFEQAKALSRLESFSSRFGALFYGLPLNTQTITLKRTSEKIPLVLPYTVEENVVPFRAGETLNWALTSTP